VVAKVVDRPVILCAYKLAAQIETEVLGLVKGVKGPVVRALDDFPPTDRVIAGIPIRLARFPGSASFELTSTAWRLECHPDFMREYEFKVRHDMAPPDRSWCYDGRLEGDEDAFRRDITVLAAHV